MSVEQQPREVDGAELAASLKQGLLRSRSVSGPGDLGGVHRRANRLRYRRRAVGASTLCALAALILVVPLVSSSSGGSDGAVQLDTADESTATEMVVVVDSSIVEAPSTPVEPDPTTPPAARPEGEAVLEVEEGWQVEAEVTPEVGEIQQDPPPVVEVPQPRVTPLSIELESGTYWIIEITSGGVTTQLHDVYATMPLNDIFAMFNLHEPSGSERGLIRMSGACRFYEGDYATSVGKLDIEISTEILLDPEDACTAVQQKPALDALVYSLLSSGEMEVVGYGNEVIGYETIVTLSSGDMTALAYRVGDSSFWDGPGVWSPTIDPGIWYQVVEAVNWHLGRG